MTAARARWRTRGWPKIFAGKAAARYFGVPRVDPRHPDVWGVVQVGVVYTGGTQDRRARRRQPGRPRRADRRLRAGSGRAGRVSSRWVETTQIAPTILDLLGLDPNALQAVQIEGTQVLPGIGR